MLNKSIALNESMSLTKAIKIVEKDGSIISQDGSYRLDRDDYENGKIRLSKWNPYNSTWEKVVALPMDTWSERADVFSWDEAVQMMLNGDSFRRVDWEDEPYLAMKDGYIYQYSPMGEPGENPYSPHASDMGKTSEWIKVYHASSKPATPKEK